MTHTTFFMVVLILAPLLVAPPSSALTYECVDATGHTIFTDSPSQLKSCTTATASLTAPHSPASRLSEPLPITVQDWYADRDNRVDEFVTGHGRSLEDSKLNQLIQAMAGFTSQTGLTWEQAIAQRPQDVQQILSASWK